MSDARRAMDQACTVIESILLTAEEPVTPTRLAELLEDYKSNDVKGLIDALNEHYQQHGHGFAIIQVAGGFQLATRPDMASWVRRFHQGRSQVRLSQAALEALAIVAFRQPVTRVDVDRVRGVNSAGVMQKLMELEMIRIVGRSDGVGKPMLFGTTREFLIHFGLNSLTDLPKPKELEELLAQGERRFHEPDQLALEVGDGGRNGQEPDSGRDANDDQSPAALRHAAVPQTPEDPDAGTVTAATNAPEKDDNRTRDASPTEPRVESGDAQEGAAG